MLKVTKIYFWISKGIWYFIKFLWDFLGFRFIFQKVNPPIDSDTVKRKPRTIMIWIIGIYVAFFGIASQRYENRIDIIENRANAIFTQLSTPIYKAALSRIPRVQRMGCPVKPEIKKPYTVWRSLFSADTVYLEIVEQLKETVETWKDSLREVRLLNADLSFTNLNGSNLQFADLSKAILYKILMREANLSGALLQEADMRGAHLDNANLQGADLTEANMRFVHLGKANLQEAILRRVDLGLADLRGADLRKANFEGANMELADLREADLREANLRYTKNLSINQLSKVKTLYKAKLTYPLSKQVGENYPHLLMNTEEERNDK